MREGVPVRVHGWAGQTDVLALRCVGHHVQGSVGVISQTGGEALSFESNSAVRIQEISSEALLVRSCATRPKIADVLYNQEGEKQRGGQKPEVDVEVSWTMLSGVFIRVCKLRTLAILYVEVDMLLRSLSFETSQHCQSPL
jgi:hypothetical protein